MRQAPQPGHHLRQPQLVDAALELQRYLRTLSPAELAKMMHTSPALATQTHQKIADWSTAPAVQTPAIDSFVGDIYSGLQASKLSVADRTYADQTLRILSGLYGVLRPLDGICPYRLEMGYKLPGSPFANLYKFWGQRIADTFPGSGVIVNVSSVEYSKTVVPFVDPARVITPQFLTIDPKTHQPNFVVVHTKIARGAFARWLITTRTTKVQGFSQFAEIGYVYDAGLSTPAEPVFVAQEFGGKGLSMRLQ